MRLWLKTQILAKYRTQADFARICGKSDDWLSKIVTGRRDPGEGDRLLITSRLGIDGQDSFLFKDWHEHPEKGDPQGKQVAPFGLY